MQKSKAPSQVAKRQKTSAVQRKKNAASQRITWRAQPRFGPPLQQRMVLRYSDFVTITSAAGVLGNYKFRANGLYDPDVTGTGHQPMYFDNYMAIYNHFTVLKSKITWKFVQDSGLTTPSYVALYIDDDSSAATTFLASSEQNTGRSTVLAATDNNTHVLSAEWDAVKYFGPNPLANDNLQGSSASDPTEQSIFTLGYANSAATSSIRGFVTIEYHVVFDELKTQEVN